MKKILVVDDNIVMFRLFQIQVKRAGCEGFFFQDGASAIEQLDKIKPDLAVLDFNLPDMKGSDIFRHIRLQPATKDIPIVFVTGTANSQDLNDIKELDASAVLSKPFSPRRLINLIHELLHLE